MKNKGKKRVISREKLEKGGMNAGKNGGEEKKRMQKEVEKESNEVHSINFSVLTQLNNG